MSESDFIEPRRVPSSAEMLEVVDLALAYVKAYRWWKNCSTEGRLNLLRSARERLQEAIKRTGGVAGWQDVEDADEILMRLWDSTYGIRSPNFPSAGFVQQIKALRARIRELKPEENTPPEEQLLAPKSELPSEPAAGIAARAVAVAYALKREGKRISVRAVAKRAGIDRDNLSKNYPDIAHLIYHMNTPDRDKLSGSKDTNGNLEATIEEDDC